MSNPSAVQLPRCSGPYCDLAADRAVDVVELDGHVRTHYTCGPFHMLEKLQQFKLTGRAAGRVRSLRYPEDYVTQAPQCR